MKMKMSLGMMTKMKTVMIGMEGITLPYSTLASWAGTMPPLPLTISPTMLPPEHLPTGTPLPLLPENLTTPLATLRRAQSNLDGILASVREVPRWKSCSKSIRPSRRWGWNGRRKVGNGVSSNQKNKNEEKRKTTKANGARRRSTSTLSKPGVGSGRLW